jgi:serine/threonine protein kinase
MEHSRILIADFGLSKVHDKGTGDRSENTETGSGEQRYEPPDVLDEGKRSHLYDNWSTACICLEFIIWLLWCDKGLQVFTGQVPHRFWEPTVRDKKPTTAKQTELRTQVSLTMEWLHMYDPRCSPETALGDFLETIDTNLFIEGAKRKRAEAVQIRNTIEGIRKKALNDPSYLHKSTEPPDENLKFRGVSSSLKEVILLKLRRFKDHDPKDPSSSENGKNTILLKTALYAANEWMSPEGRLYELLSG